MVKLEKDFSAIHACMRALLLQTCLPLFDPVDGSPPGSFVHGILQARILEWVAISFSRGSSQPGIKPKSAVSPAFGWQFLLLAEPLGKLRVCVTAILFL